jgi:hypothetical protein
VLLKVNKVESCGLLARGAMKGPCWAEQFTSTGKKQRQDQNGNDNDRTEANIFQGRHCAQPSQTRQSDVEFDFHSGLHSPSILFREGPFDDLAAGLAVKLRQSGASGW